MGGAEKLALRISAMRRMKAIGLDRPLIAYASPTMIRDHVDGPCVIFIDGSIHWLSLWERLLVRLGRCDAWDLEWKHNPLLTGADQ